MEEEKGVELYETETTKEPVVSDEPVYVNIRSAYQGLHFVNRVVVPKDRNYLVAFVFCVVVYSLIGVFTYRVHLKHHYLLSLTGSLFIAAVGIAALISVQYKCINLGHNPFSVSVLSKVPLLELLFLVLLAAAIVVEGWTILLALVFLLIGIYDTLHMATESIQFASVLLDFASDMVSADPELAAPILRNVRIVAFTHSIFLVAWTGVLVDIAAGALNFPLIFFSFFCLFWITQTFRGFVSYYITGALCFKLGLDAEAKHGHPSLLDMQRTLVSRGLSTSFGSVCAGGLLIGPGSLLWGIADIYQRLRSKNGDIQVEKNVNGVLSGISNRYGWGRVALAGTPFRRASKESWKRMTESGITGAISEDQAETFIRSWSWIFGSVTALLSLSLLPHDTHQSSEILVVFFMAAFFLGAANASLLLEPLRATVAAIFISFAENPQGVEEESPIIHHRFTRICELSLA